MSTGPKPSSLCSMFRAEIGTTPSAWVESARIEAARKLLEQGLQPKLTAARCGFRDIETFRRAFIRQLGISPARYRERHGLVRDGGGVD
ncbi:MULTISPECIES: helix-turn-helix domain-containing protein [Sphingobium]|uniref:helix-turn-helix domain-containing protein n=1 Tax=Sphingobium TaxID=165695 RepID=UPI0009D6E2B3